MADVFPMRIENVKALFPWAIAIVPLLWLPKKAPRVRRQRPEQDSRILPK
jgi:hypothetical protein